MNLSAPCIRRPVATTLVMLALFFAGILAFEQLPVAPLPRIDFPTVVVGASLPGASPETMAAAVATPLERRLGRIAGLNELTSSSALGTSALTLQFDLSRDGDAAARDVQAAINAATGDLPSNLPSMPTFHKINPADAPILVLAVTSKTLPLGRLYDLANSIMAQKLSQVAGVGQVSVGGGQQPAVRIQADPQKLAAMGLTLADLRRAIGSANLRGATGRLEGDTKAMSVGIDDQLMGARPIAQLIIAQPQGIPVRLKDVASVFDDVENNRVAAWYSHERAVLMIIRREPGANILTTIDRIKSVLPSLVKAMPAGFDVDIAIDRAITIRAAVHDVMVTLVVTLFLVVAVVFAFLRDIKTTLIPSVAVPLSLLGTFGAMYMLNFSLNNLSLMALTISTGFVVDDAIVVTENIARHIELGVSPLKASLVGAQEIGFTVVSITASLVAVFVPILFMGGIVGRLFFEFAMTLSVAIVISAVVSLTLVPMLMSRLGAHKTFGAAHASLPDGVGAAHAEAMQSLYGRMLNFTLKRQKSMLAATAVMVGLTVMLYAIVPKGLFPQQDTGMLIGFSEAPQSVSYAQMYQAQKKANEIILADPDVETMVSFIGATGGTAENTGTILISLRPLKKRKHTADQIIARLRQALAPLEDLTVYTQAVQDLRMGGRSSRTQFQYVVQSSSLRDLRQTMPRLVNALKRLSSLRDVASDQQDAGLEGRLRIDRLSAARLGVTPKDIDDALYDAFGQRQITTSYTESGQYRVILEVPEEQRRSLDDVGRLWVRKSNGSDVLVPMTQLVSVAPDTTPLAVNHQGQFAATTLSFNLAPNISLGQAINDVRETQESLNLPRSVSAGFGGTAQAFGASSEKMPWLIILALACVYGVLGILYESFVHPLTILSTLPSAGIGALICLWLCGMDLSIIAFVGIILLIGIVKKNAIMMVDVALDLQRRAHLTPLNAIHLACTRRLRPIMMTTLAALLGAIPMALGSGDGAELRRPLGVAIAGGLLVSQMLTLFTTPNVYLALSSRKERRKRVA